MITFQLQFWFSHRCSPESETSLASAAPTGGQRLQWGSWNPQRRSCTSWETSSGNRTRRRSWRGHPGSLQGRLKRWRWMEVTRYRTKTRETGRMFPVQLHRVVCSDQAVFPCRMLHFQIRRCSAVSSHNVQCTHIITRERPWHTRLIYVVYSVFIIQ